MSYTMMIETIRQKRKHIDKINVKMIKNMYLKASFKTNFFYKKDEKIHVMKKNANIARCYCKFIERSQFWDADVWIKLKCEENVIIEALSLHAFNAFNY